MPRASKPKPSAAFQQLVDDYEAAGGGVLGSVFPNDTALHKAFLAWAKKTWPRWYAEIDGEHAPSLRARMLEQLIYDEEDEGNTVCGFFDQLPAATRATVAAAIAAHADAMWPARKGTKKPPAAAKPGAGKAGAAKVASARAARAPASTIAIGAKHYPVTTTALELEGQGLTALPDAIGDLAALETLDLAGNPITALPASLARCAQLRKLFVGGTALTSLPPLPQVEVLSAPRTSPALIASLAAVPGLTNLCIAGCGLTELPASLRALKRLTYLDFKDNAITALPPWIDELAVSNFAWNEGLPAPLQARLSELERKNRVAAGRKRRGS